MAGSTTVFFVFSVMACLFSSTANTECSNLGNCDTTANGGCVVDSESGNDTCYCNTGYKFTSDSDSTCMLEDRDECLDKSDNCTQECTNNVGGFTCTCRPGYHGDGYTCTECPDNKFGTNCSSDCTCSATGTASCDKVNGTCYCKPGWTGLNCTDDVDECTRDPCPVHSTCNNTDGSHECTCNTGFEDNGDGNCTDRDECLDKSDNCTQECTNNVGGFTCTCRPGYHGDGYTCTECPDNKFGTNCSSDCTCSATGTDSCDKVNGTCYCKPGWTGLNCTDDVDECTRDPCPVHSTCNNTDGSHECTCNTGFEDNGDGNCTDRDECLDKSDNCTQECTNNVGGFTCTCRPGYHGDGYTCTGRCVSCSYQNAGDGKTNLECVTEPFKEPRTQNISCDFATKACVSIAVYDPDYAQLRSFGRFCLDKVGLRSEGCNTDQNPSCYRVCSTDLCNQKNITLLYQEWTNGVPPLAPGMLAHSLLLTLWLCAVSYLVV